MSWIAPSTSDFKTFFARDFNFAPASDPLNQDFVLDSDITRAINEGLINFNIGLFGTDAQVTNVFMYLVAFCLVRNIQNSTKGLSSQSKFPITSNSVGNVSVNYSVPEAYAKDPWLSQFTQNGYGMRYLELALPYTVGGGIGIAEGGTTWC